MSQTFFYYLKLKFKCQIEPLILFIYLLTIDFIYFYGRYVCKKNYNFSNSFYNNSKKDKQI